MPGSDDPLATLRRRFGLAAFRPHQEEIVHAVLSGRSVLAVLPTSAGKSLCYQLPAVMLGGLTVVVSPLIALMKDQVDALNRRGIPAIALHGQLPLEAARAALEAIRRQDVQLVYVAPERLLNGAFLAALSRVPVRLLAIDEAHCLSQWGHDFRPDYRMVPVFQRKVGMPPVLALTATAPRDVRTDIERELHIDQQVIAPPDRPNLRYGVCSAATEREQEALLAGWLAPADEGSVIVYAPTRKATEAWAARIGRSRRDVAAYHAGMEGARREAIQEAFMTGKARIIVATTAFGMGVDKPDIRAVLHVGLAESVESYVQEVGRAGRDGEPAWGVTISLMGRDALLRRRLFDRQRPDRAWLQGRLAGIAQTPVGGRYDLVGAAQPDESQALLLLPHLLERGIVDAPGERAEMRAVRLREALGPHGAEAILAAIERRHAHKVRRFSALVSFMQGTGCRRDALADYFSAPRARVREAVCCDRCQPDAFRRADAPLPPAGRPAPRTAARTAARTATRTALDDAAPLPAPLPPPAPGGLTVAALDCAFQGAAAGAGGRATRLIVWKHDGAVSLHEAAGPSPVHTLTGVRCVDWQADARLATWGSGPQRLSLIVYGVLWHRAMAASDIAQPVPGRAPPAMVPAQDEAAAATDGALREALGQWRRAKARERGVPAYVICWDRHLDAIVRERPQTLEALGRIAGLPAPTREAYGEEILAVVATDARPDA